MSSDEVHGEVLVGDVGSVYRVPVYDTDLAEVNFDPSSAMVKQIVFKMPGAAGLLTRDATAVQIDINGTQVWCLTYTVLATDVVPYVSGSVGGFHQQEGRLSLEGYLEFSSSQKWSSQVIVVDFRGRPLKVVARLAA